jgi:CO/xanthine dehydrogenase FAD-binding subunit
LGFHAPRTLPDALALLAGGGGRVLAGGTDLFPAQSGAPPVRDLIDLTGIADLQGITRGSDGWRIGACATWSDLAAHPLPPAFDGLKAAARSVGGVQIQNAGTLAGNLCNASPAADGVPVLLTLDARVDIAGLAGRRVVPLSDFIIGPRRVALAADEVVTAVLVPDAGGARGGFAKLGARRHLVISIAMVAVLIGRDPGGRIASARVAVGSCAPVARRLPGLEAALAGRGPTDLTGDFVTLDHLSPLSPMDDMRGTASYRMRAVAELCQRAVQAVMADG